VKRYLAKYTVNPAIAAGIDDYVGTLEPGNSPTWCCGTPRSSV